MALSQMWNELQNQTWQRAIFGNSSIAAWFLAAVAFAAVYLVLRFIKVLAAGRLRTLEGGGGRCNVSGGQERNDPTAVGVA